MESAETNSVLQSMLSEPGLLLAALEHMDQALAAQDRLSEYHPYPKQAEFHAAGATYRERMLMAGNQLGKTLSAGFECAMHLTGRYPDWWQGKRFDRPTRGIAGSESTELTRKGVQRLLLGPPEDENAYGTGTIPKDALADWSRKQGVPDAVSSILVRHVSGGVSSVQLASYDQGRTKWQADTVDWVWFDEEPPYDIYTEGLTRTNTTLGPVFVTLTPLLGMSEVVVRYMLEKPPGTHLTMMTIDDVLHYTAEQKAAIIASYKSWERKARTQGIPQLGSGRIFPIEEDAIKVESFPIPDYWARIGGLDFGWDHPSAGVQIAWDRDSDTFYVTHAHRAREATPLMFAAAVKPWGNYPWAWPHDGLQHDKGSGEQLAQQYKAQGLAMLPERATFADGTNGVEAGLAEMLDLMQTGRWKVFAHLKDWFEEFNLYHRKDGKIVKEREDLISASRYAFMMKRCAKSAKDIKPKPKTMYTPAPPPQPNGWMGG